MINRYYILLIFSFFLYVLNKNFCHLTYKIDNDILNVIYYIVETIIMNIMSFSIYMLYKNLKIKSNIILNLFLSSFIISLNETRYTILVYCNFIPFVDSYYSFAIIIQNIIIFILLMIYATNKGNINRIFQKIFRISTFFSNNKA